MIPRHPLLFYDGHCGLCHRAVLFVLAHDEAARFRFAPLGGQTFLAEIPPAMRVNLPDSLVLLEPDGRVRVEFDAVRGLLLHLGGGWRLLGRLAGLVPRVLGDLGYRFVARIRHRLFRRPDAACPLLPPALAGRFSA